MSKEKLIKRNPASHIIPHTSQKGITLIALVVTIIVILIVTGVTMGAVLGDEGLIEKAKQRAAEQTKKSDEEAIDIAIAGQEMDILQSGIDTELLETELEEKYDDVIVATATPDASGNPVDEIIITLSNKGEDSRSYPINKKSGERVDYSTPVPTSNATTAPTQTIAPTVTVNNQISIANLPAGTYVNYIDNNGNTIPCVILYDTAYNTAHGTNYGIQAMTVGTLKEVTIGSTDFEEARIAYNSAIATLNSEAMTYLNTNYATDARCIGSNPGNKNAEGEEKDTTFWTYTSTSYGTFKDGDENYINDYTQLDNLGITLDYNCWTASRRVVRQTCDWMFRN